MAGTAPRRRAPPVGEASRLAVDLTATMLDRLTAATPRIRDVDAVRHLTCHGLHRIQPPHFRRDVAPRTRFAQAPC